MWTQRRWPCCRYVRPAWRSKQSTLARLDSRFGCHSTSSYVENDTGEYFKNQPHSGAVGWKIGWGYRVDHHGAACNVVWPTVHDSDRGMYLRIVAIFGHFRCFLALFRSNVAPEKTQEPASQWRCGLVNWLGIQGRPPRCCLQLGAACS